MNKEKLERIQELAARVEKEQPSFKMLIIGDSPVHSIRMQGHPRLAEALEVALLALLNEDPFVRGRQDAFRELQRHAAANGGVYDPDTNTVLDSDQLLERIHQLEQEKA
jgi:hypothetical protein